MLSLNFLGKTKFGLQKEKFVKYFIAFQEKKCM